MPILIDAWNLIRNANSPISEAEEDSLKSARMLIDYFREFQLTHKDPVILVFDSRREYLGIEYKNTPELTVVPTKDADMYIKKYISGIPERQRRNVRVVSSDNSVYHYARTYYATAIKSETFWNKLEGS